MYDITNKESFDSLNSWIIYIEKNAPNKNIYKILVGNKCDDEENRIVSFQEGINFAELNGFNFMEISARNDLNINEVFEYLIYNIIRPLISENDIKKSNFYINNIIKINKKQTKTLLKYLNY